MVSVCVLSDEFLALTGQGLAATETASLERMIVPGNLISASTAAIQLALGGALDRVWNVAAGDLDWSCWATAAHITDALFSYASQVVAQTSDGYLPIEARVKATATPESLLGCVEMCGELLRLAVDSVPDEARGWPYGTSDPEGFAAMGVTEVLVHTFDISRGLGIDWVPPRGLSELAILRLFPEAPPGEPSAVLLWCTGRAALDDRPRPNRRGAGTPLCANRARAEHPG